MKTPLKFLIIFAVFIVLGVVISVQNFGFDIKSKSATLSQAVHITSARHYYIDSFNGNDDINNPGTSP
jgi:Na+/H+ antiporter NhaC